MHSAAQATSDVRSRTLRSEAGWEDAVAARDGREKFPAGPELVKLGADLALSAEVPTGPGASRGLPISRAVTACHLRR